MGYVRSWGLCSNTELISKQDSTKLRQKWKIISQIFENSVHQVNTYI